MPRCSHKAMLQAMSSPKKKEKRRAGTLQGTVLAGSAAGILLAAGGILAAGSLGAARHVDVAAPQ